MQSAAELSGLDTSRLPEEITEFYLEISQARLAAAESGADATAMATATRIARLARTYTSYIAGRIAVDQTRSVAFVAATAFAYLSDLANIADPQQEQAPLLEANAVSHRILATVLFLIAEYPSDAVAVAAGIESETRGTTTSSDRLARAVALLARGQLQDSFDTAATDAVNDDAEEAALYERATEALWDRLVDGIALLAASIGTIDTGDRLADETPLSVFEQVREVTAERIDLAGPEEGETSTAFSLFAGPHMLARLLIRLSETLPPQGLLTVPPPDGLDPDSWSGLIAPIAKQRPYLWPNHRDAVEQGYLTPGTSAVISFPTGAGKSTLAELKVATALARDLKAVIVAPTHALVAQTKAAMRESFPGATVSDSLVQDGYFADLDEEPTATVADISVMTPERCLMLLDLTPEAFNDVGLFVLDECHILHPGQGIDDRRSLDAMLCLLRFIDIVPELDLLLISAMVANTSELADWLSSVLGRACIPLEVQWKPTRQARGALVFDSSTLSDLQSKLRDGKTAGKTRRPGAAIKRELKATPRGFFALQHNWQSRSTSDYTVCSLIPQDVPLAASDDWRLTSNANQVSAILGTHMSIAGLKTIVFIHNKQWCESVANQADAILADANRSTTPTPREDELLAAAIDEVGDVDHVYRPLPHGSACHHGLLLPVERDLVETSFRRPDGASVIAASPTLAQGMNLPASAVILVGTTRYDQTDGRRHGIEAHSLLNAAGRAGRAGLRSEGIVLVVPDQPIALNVQEHRMDRGWFQMREDVFGGSDQCLTIDDPVELHLDALQTMENAEGATAYFLNRLPIGDDEDADPVERSRSLLRKSFGAFRATRNERTDSFVDQIDRAATLRRALLSDEALVQPIDRVAAANGVSVVVLEKLNERLSETENIQGMTVRDWVDWLFASIQANPGIRSQVLGRVESRDSLFSSVERRGEINESTELDRLARVIGEWIGGKTLLEIENLLPGDASKFCRRARSITQRATLELSVLMGYVPQLFRIMLQDGDEPVAVPIPLAVASACIRHGFESTEQLVLSSIVRGVKDSTRCRVHNFATELERHLAPPGEQEQLRDTRARLEEAIELSLLDQ